MNHNSNGSCFCLQVEDSDVKLSEKAQQVLKVKLNIFVKLKNLHFDESVFKKLSCYYVCYFYSTCLFCPFSNFDLQNNTFCVNFEGFFISENHTTQEQKES